MFFGLVDLYIFEFYLVFLLFFCFNLFIIYKFIIIVFEFRIIFFHLYKSNMEINGLTQICEMCFLLYFIVCIFIIRLYLDKKLKKKEYK